MDRGETDRYRLRQQGLRRAAGGHRQSHSAPIKRMGQEARDRGTLIDATFGRKTKAVLIMDSDHIVLSALQPTSVAGRLSGKEAGSEGAEEEMES